ncbi:MAG: hypothetical protein RL432_1568 [Bacteroidota bacterium]|jgi:hypothetical protein
MYIVQLIPWDLEVNGLRLGVGALYRPACVGAGLWHLHAVSCMCIFMYL